MTLTITLTDEDAEGVRRAAEARGLDLPAFAVVAIKNEALNTPSPAHPLPWNEFIHQLTEGLHDPRREPLSDYAVSREGIYEDHP